jgi:WD40 repeat protein
MNIFRFSGFFILFVSEITFAQINIDQKPIKVFKKQEGAIFALAFNPDSKILASGSDDKTCLFRSIPDGKEVLSLTGFNNSVKACAFTSDSKYFLAAIERTIRIYYPNGELVKQLGGTATNIWSFSFNPLTNQVLIGSYDKNLRVIDFTTGKLHTVNGHLKNALAVAYSPDNKFMASGSLDETVKLWDAASFTLLHTFTGHGGNIYDIVFTPDSKKLISASNDNSIRIWDLSSQKWEKSLLGNQKAVMCIAISPDGYYLVSGSYDGLVMLWDILRGEHIYSFREHSGTVNALAFSPDGKYFASGGSDELTMLWEMKPEIFVQKYFSREFQEEIDKSGLFLPKAKEETKDVYKIRQGKAEQLRIQLVGKYYNRYLSEIKGKPIL